MRFRPFDFEQEGFDAAIHFGAESWPNAGFLKLFDERLVACCAPELLQRHPVVRPEDLLELPLLQLETRPGSWPSWFSQHGVTRKVPYGMVFDQFAPMIQSAISGLGVALLPEFLAKSELADGRLQAVWGAPMAGEGSYYLVWPRVGEWYPPLQAFRAWLAEEAADPDGTANLPG